MRGPVAIERVSRGVFGLLVAILAIVSLPTIAGAADVWRMAGTFNGWNTTDGAYEMAPVPGVENVFTIERAFDVGTYKFKFVKNGNWAEGHFGAGEAARALTTPGGDITLEIPVHGVFRISLFPGSKEWKFEVGTIDHPVIVKQIRGVPITGRPFMLDLSKSLLPLPHEEYDLLVTDPGRVVGVVRAVDRSLTAAVTPFRTELQHFDIVLTDPDGVVIREPFEVWVDQRYGYHLVMNDEAGALHPRSRNDEQLEPVGPRLHRSLVEIDKPVTVTQLGVRFGLEEVASERDIKVEPGRYVLEVNDGTIKRQPLAERGSTLLIPGNWQKFTYTPPDTRVVPSSVFLVGDFNDWAMPGTPGAIEMASRADGRFVTIIEIPEGSMRYAFVLDGGRLVHDTRNKESTQHRGQVVSVINTGPSAADFGAPEPNFINPHAIRHTPAMARDFDGISRTLGLADVSVLTLAGDAEAASVEFEAKQSDGSVERLVAPMVKSGTEAGFDRWSARIMTGLPEFKYAFQFMDGTFGHITPDYSARLEPDPLQIPDWAKGAVWYQIFPERFRNGNPLNDPNGPGVYEIAWNADWYKPTPEELAAQRVRSKMGSNEQFSPPNTYDNLFHVVWDRRYGGDLQGVVEKLDELADLGITAIYLNPVFEAESMHKYDATDYRHIDDNFGTPPEAGQVPATYAPPASEGLEPSTWAWTPADRYFVDVLIPEAKKRGIRVVIDGVFNHTGRSFFAFQDVLKNGKASPFADWYFVEFGADGMPASWTAWDGPSGWLPKFKQNPDRSLVAPVESHIFDITRRWMDPNADGDPSDGIDGWRLDVPLDVGLPFWERWRTLVKSINPDAVIIAEIWDEADDVLRGKHFDTHMNYPFAKAVTEWLSVKPGMTSTELSTRLSATFGDAPQTNLIHQNLFTSHDSDRYVSKLLNPGRDFDSNNRLQDGGTNLLYKEVKPPADIYALSIIGVAIQATYQGAPMVYYGDEVGMWGADDPSDRKPYPWPDTGANLNADDNPVPSIRDAYQRWFRLRADPTIGPVLRYGDTRHFDTGNPGVFAFARSLNGVEVFVVANRDKAPFDATTILPGVTQDGIVDGLSARYWVMKPE